MAGHTSHASNPFLADFILLGQGLEQLGFAYSRGVSTVIYPAKYNNA